MANVSVHTDAQRRDIRVVIGAATPMPWSVPFASELMRGSRRPEDLQAFAAQAASDMQALSDTRCDSEYRRDVVRVLLTRALTRHFCNEDEVTS
jgi:CO/xanthine dehydrogenase FAD-binding subunit